MAIKPILFNTDMVRAILDGRKTVTRRVVKLPRCGYFEHEPPRGVIPPYCSGDMLYVRETWCWCPCWDCGHNSELGCIEVPSDRFYNTARREYGCYGFKASFLDNEYPSVDCWHPSIHMPKDAARIFLRVNDVRVKRLQEIDDEGAKAEGANYGIGVFEKMKETAIDRFARIWDSTIKKNDLLMYGWGANPWVWVIQFERCEKPLQYADADTAHGGLMSAT